MRPTRAHAAAIILLSLAACSEETKTKQDSAVQPDTTSQVDASQQLDAGVDFAWPDLAVVTDAPVGDAATADAPPADSAAADAGPPPANDKCASAEALTWSGATITKQVDTTTATNDLSLDLTGCTGDATDGKDVFYKITLPPGSYELKLAVGKLDPALYVLSSCSKTACVKGSDKVNDDSSTPPKYYDEEIALGVKSSSSYIIAVDAYQAAEAGKYTLTISKVGAAPDGGVPDAAPDAGPPADVGAADAPPPTDGTVTTGTIVITEFMANPGAVYDTAGEWLEVYNPGSATVNLKGWTLKDQGSDSHKIAADLLVPAGKYVVLARNKDSTTNGGVTAIYQYSSFNLSNSSDEIELYDGASTLVDTVSYTAAQAPSGSSWSVKSPALDNSKLANWCNETTAWSGSQGDKGTPGAAAGCK